MRSNAHPEFVGVEALTVRHARQVAEFEAWAAAGDWARFHSEHYDWWAFPVDRPSALGYAWVVCEAEVAELLGDPGFVDRFRRGLELVAAAMGWDLPTGAPLPDPSPGQEWPAWPVRLHKMARSARLFGLGEAFDSLATYARRLMAAGEPFEYGGQDLAWLFHGAADPHGPGCA